MIGRGDTLAELLIDGFKGVKRKGPRLTESKQDDALDDRPDATGIIAYLVIVGIWLKNLEDAIQMPFAYDDLAFSIDVANPPIGGRDLYFSASARCFAERANNVVALVRHLCFHIASPIV